MRALIDTNVLIDYIAMREPHYASARRIIAACDKGLVSGCIAAHSIPDAYYILRKAVSAADRRKALRCLCEIFTAVIPPLTPAQAVFIIKTTTTTLDEGRGRDPGRNGGIGAPKGQRPDGA